MKRLIRLYQWVCGPFVGNCCRFYPSCSNYALGVLEKYGFFRGMLKIVIRIFKCQPFHPGGVDLP